MKNKQLTYTVQGAGLSFPVAALLFVFSGNWRSIFLIPLGAAAGFLAGWILPRSPLSAGSGNKFQIRNGKFQWLQEKFKLLAGSLLNRHLIIRFASLLVVGCALFILAWGVGYIFLPEGALHAGAEAHMARGALDSASQTVGEEWMKIFRANLIPVFVIIFGSLLIKINGIPFGYLVALYNLVLYGLFVGTNSFAIPYAQRMAPSFAILRRSGPYEMTALVLLAAATCLWSFFEVKRLFRTAPERVIPGPRFCLSDFVAVLFGIGLMMVANWVEATMIMVQAP